MKETKEALGTNSYEVKALLEQFKGLNEESRIELLKMILSLYKGKEQQLLKGLFQGLDTEETKDLITCLDTEAMEIGTQGKEKEVDLPLADNVFVYQAVRGGIQINGLLPDKKNEIEELFVPSKIGGKTVVGISQGAFKGNSKLRKSTISSTVKSIGACAFGDCVNLKKVHLPNGLKEIQEYTFDKCVRLESINIPNEIDTIGDFAFYQCKELSGIVLPKGTRKIGKCAFAGCSKLSRIHIPKSVTVIKASAFSSCWKLQITCESFFKPSTWSRAWNNGSYVNIEWNIKK